MSIRTAVQQASPRTIQQAFKRRVVKDHLPKQRWLGLLNRYRKDTISNLSDDLNPSITSNSIKPNQLAEYISVSTVTHCFDSWNYFSRSIESVLSGDTLTAIHLAYYSELRAVMSLMATQGIGIYDNKHIWFDRSGSYHRITGTHNTNAIADAIIKEWANTPASKDLIFNIINVNSISLDRWVNATGYSHLNSILQFLLKDWLEKWSMDLNLREDKNIRNEISYRPKIHEESVDFKVLIEKIVLIWEACEPSNSGSFRILDLHLLRVVLDEIYGQYRRNIMQQNPMSINEFVINTKNNLGLNREDALQRFLSDINPRNDHFVLVNAKKNVKRDNSYCYSYDCIPIICRALLLLRLATGATEKFLDKSITRELTRFWWQNIGLNLGLWSDGNEPDDFKDLYQDIADAVEDLDFSNPSHWDSLKTTTDVYAPELMKLKQFQRVGLWGIGL